MNALHGATVILLITATGSFSAQSTTTPKSCEGKLETAMNHMHESMHHIGRSDDFDTQFNRLMIPHHQAALEMAKAELLCGHNPAARRLAQEIITDQQSEIDLMNLWLKKYQRDVAAESGTKGKNK